MIDIKPLLTTVAGAALAHHEKKVGQKEVEFQKYIMDKNRKMAETQEKQAQREMKRIINENTRAN